MKLLSISFFAILFLVFPVFNQSDVSADGWLYGNVYTVDFQGRPFPLKGVFINKVVDCNKMGNRDFCQQSCGGNGFCPSKPQTYYTEPNGNYKMEADGDGSTLIKNGRPAVCSEGGFEIGCGINCGLGTHQFSAYFPSNYDLRNFPLGIDLRKGHFEAVTPADQLSAQSSKIAVLTDSAGSQYYQSTQNLNNSSNNPNLDFKWVWDPLPISGVVTDNQNRPVAGVTMEIVNDQGTVRLTPVTDSSGRFTVPSDSLLKNTRRYAVRVLSVPVGYELKTRKVTTTDWSYIVTEKRDARPPDNSYEQQESGSNDCSGPDYNPVNNVHQTGRCNFKIDPIPPTIATSATTPPTGSVSATLTNPPAGGPTPPVNVVFNPTCAAISTTGATANAILVNGTRVDFNSFASINIKLDGVVGQVKSFIIPVTVNYTNGACRAINLGINYDSRAIVGPAGGTIPTATPPDPRLCLPATGRPNTCACTVNSQCQSNICDPTSRSCISEPFIKTEGGDVHSNEEVQGR